MDAVYLERIVVRIEQNTFILDRKLTNFQVNRFLTFWRHYCIHYTHYTHVHHYCKLIIVV